MDYNSRSPSTWLRANGPDKFCSGEVFNYEQQSYLDSSE